MDALTRLISRFAPGWAASRLMSRGRLIAAQRYYESVQSSNYRPRRGGGQSADAVMDRSRGRLREYARHLDENHDLAVGVLDDLVVNIVGTGVGVEPMALMADGSPAVEINRQLLDLWSQWWSRPEVTGEIPGPELERLVCRTWLRDGEVFLQHVINNQFASYPTAVPYLLEALESDFVPFDLTTDAITQGVAKNTWGKPVGYYVYKNHPGSLRNGSLETKYIQADRMLHIKFVRRLHQTRGVSIFHAVLNRLDDIKDYEESERIAARVAAALTGYIKRNGDYETPVNDDGSRAFEMAPGMIFDNLMPGEDVGVIKSDRPNAGLEPFRNAQLRAVAAGTGTRFSSIAKNYNGTYSAQRQELVEGSIAYRRLFNVLRHVFYQPVWQRFIDASLLAGAIRLPRGVDQSSLYRPEFRHPATPWIDPAKEATAFEKFIQIGVKSRHQIIRDIGGDPATVDAQLFADPLDARTPGAEVAPGVSTPVEPDADETPIQQQDQAA